MNIYVLHHLWKDYITKIKNTIYKDVSHRRGFTENPFFFFNGYTKIYGRTGFLLKYLPDMRSQNCANVM